MAAPQKKPPPPPQATVQAHIGKFFVTAAPGFVAPFKSQKERDKDALDAAIGKSLRDGKAGLEIPH